MHRLFFPFLAFLAVGQGYILDSSCSGRQDVREFIRINMELAFAQAEGARNALNERPWRRDNPEHQALIELAEWIFREDGTQPPVVGPIQPDNRKKVPKQALNDPQDNRGRLDLARDVYDGILTMRQLKGPDDPKDDFDVEIFCDLTRFGSTSVPDMVYETIKKFVLKSGSDENKHKYDCSKPFIQAWTVPVNKPPGLPTPPYQMQICPNFLQKSMKAPVQSSVGHKKHSLGDFIPGVSRTEMDVHSTIDNTLLHEMEHTRSGGLLDDIGKGLAPYGWKNILKKQGDATILNADNPAYFALGVRMIKSQNWRPQKDGTIKDLTSA